MAWTFEEIETVVISLRIRLARNFSSFPFPRKMDEKQAQDVVNLVETCLAQFDNFQRFDVSKLSKFEADDLQEQHLISPALLCNPNGAAFVSWDNTISIMVNEEDHLREQYIYRGCEFLKAYERIAAVDDGLNSSFDFAFDRRMGYLTACPTNLGTGMRASAMMFLPGLAWNGGLKKLMPTLRKAGITIRGAFGEGTKADGYLYQISNERTLGVSENDLLEQMQEVTYHIYRQEIQARKEMLDGADEEIEDRCLRAYGVLTNCALLGMQELYSKMGEIRLGVMLGYFQTSNISLLQDFSEGFRAEYLRDTQLELDEERDRACDRLRAQLVRERLPQLVEIKR